MTPFWYLLGMNYEVIVFKNRLVAEQERNRLNDESDDLYYEMHEGKYGEEFSGYYGHERPDKEG
jgi:hypothetical protein